MEVHHHAHPASGGTRKKWTHYLWEFLMLFLAVFCGFIAENAREHMVEHKKAKAYARSLLKDLQNDTADIINANRYESRTVAMIDSLMSLTENERPIFKGGQFYYFVRFAMWQYTIDWNKATLNQLISSGNLRYFTNPELVTLISEYNTTSNTIIGLEQAIDGNRIRAVEFRDVLLKASMAQRFFDLTMDDIIHGNGSAYIDSLRTVDLSLQGKDPAVVNSLMNALLATKTNRKILEARYYPRAIKEATAIMELLKKEYHLE